MTLAPSQKVIVQTWERLDVPGGGSWFDTVGQEDPYTPTDHATARELGLPVERVGEALVAAGKRPPVWWIG